MVNLMTRDLYFVNILNQALRDPHPREALRRAFAEIEALGKRPGYRKGYEQFLRFMSLVKANTEAGGSAIDPEALRSNLDDLAGATEPMTSLPALVLECGGRIIASIPVAGRGSLGIVGGLAPGSYLVRLETGRILWQGELDKSDLIWRHAFPEEPLPLAAETDEITCRIGGQILLLDGEIVIRLVPGRVSGQMEFFFNG